MAEYELAARQERAALEHLVQVNVTRAARVCHIHELVQERGLHDQRLGVLKLWRSLQHFAAGVAGERQQSNVVRVFDDNASRAQLAQLCARQALKLGAQAVTPLPDRVALTRHAVKRLERPHPALLGESKFLAR